MSILVLYFAGVTFLRKVHCRMSVAFSLWSGMQSFALQTSRLIRMQDVLCREWYCAICVFALLFVCYLVCVLHFIVLRQE